MTIDLSHHEAGTPYPGHYKHDLADLQERLQRIQTAHIVHGRRALVLFEGWDAGGKGGAIRRLTADWDPRYHEVWPIGPPTAEEAAHHFLWRFWRRLPADGNIAVFDRSWYGRVAVERVEGFASPAEVEAAYGEINAFEAQHRAHGTTIVKLFLHVTQAEQDARFRDRLKPSLGNDGRRGPTTIATGRKRDEYLEAYEAMFARTSTDGCTWVVIDGNDKKAARDRRAARGRGPAGGGRLHGPAPVGPGGATDGRGGAGVRLAFSRELEAAQSEAG